MHQKKFNKKFIAGFDNLSFDQQLDLSICVCKKMFFDYEVYIKSTNCSGDPDFVIDAIGAIKKYNTEAVTGEKLIPLVDTLQLYLQNLEIYIEIHSLEDDV